MNYVRYIVVIFFIAGFSMEATSQKSSNILEKRISINLHNLSIKEILKNISDKTGIGFSYSNDLVLFSQKVSIHVVDKPLRTLLDQLIDNTKISYQVIGNQIVFNVRAEPPKKYNISGYVEDSNSGEKLIGSYITDSLSLHGAITNAFGYFTMSQNAGICCIAVHQFGYVDKIIKFNLHKDTSLIIKLSIQPYNLKEVKIVSSMSEAKLSNPQTGLMNISSQEVKKLPLLLGEADVMRAIQIMPGIQAASERSAGISVRGGSIDQNLYLMDDAPIFQISHMIGLYSVFNNDAIKDVKIYKGDIPANYGGRLASVLDIRLKDGNMQKFAFSGGIGLLTSNLSIEGPIVKDRISFIVSGKYSYTALLLKLGFRADATFFDLNCKLNAIINDKSRIYFSSYNGGDHANIGLNSKYNNNTMSMRWNYIYSPKLFSNISLVYSNYAFKSGNVFNTSDSPGFIWNSGIKQATLKAEFNYYINEKNALDFGISSTYSNFIPGKLTGNQRYIENLARSVPFSNRVVNEQEVLDNAVYISNQQKVTDKLSLRYGIRANLYQNLGGHWVYKLNNYQVVDSFYAAKNKVYSNDFRLEPRISLNYRLTQNSALKASYTYSTQHDQLLIKTSGGGPLDVWFPSGINIKPQISSQYGLGYVHYFLYNSVETSIEGYYKDMNNIIDYKDGATFLDKSTFTGVDKTNYNSEEQLRTGKGYAYGAELMVKGNFKKFDGFVSYTYGRSMRTIPYINFGETYLSPFDKPHTLDVFMNYNISKRISLSANFRIQSGQVTTVPIYSMEMFGKTFKGYSKRNDYRLPTYQRLDLSLTLRNKERQGKHYHSEWIFSVINVLNHPNISTIDFVPSEENPQIILAKGIVLFGFIPSISYRFYF